MEPKQAVRALQAMTDADDFNSLRAHAKLDAHERVCTERYGNIDAKLNDLSRKLDTKSTINDARLNALSNRMWAAAGAMILLCITGLAGTIAIILTRGLR